MKWLFMKTISKANRIIYISYRTSSIKLINEKLKIKGRKTRKIEKINIKKSIIFTFTYDLYLNRIYISNLFLKKTKKSKIILGK